MDQDAVKESPKIPSSEINPSQAPEIREPVKLNAESSLRALISKQEHGINADIKSSIAGQSIRDALITITREEGETDEDHAMNIFIAQQGIVETAKLLKTTDFGLEDAKQILTQEYSSATGFDLDQSEEIFLIRDLDAEMEGIGKNLGVSDIFSLYANNKVETREEIIRRIKSFEAYFGLKAKITEAQKQIMSDGQGFYSRFAEKMHSIFVKQGERIDNWTLNKRYLKFIGEHKLTSDALTAFSTLLISAGAIGYLLNPQTVQAEPHSDINNYQNFLEEAGLSDQSFTEDEALDSSELAVHKQASEFMQDIRFLKAQGYKINVERSISGDSSDKLGIADTFLGLNNNTEQDFSVKIGNPYELFRYKYEINKEIPIELSDNHEIKINPFQIISEETGSGKGVYRVYNWLDPVNPLLVEKEISVDEIDKEAAELKQVLNERINGISTPEKLPSSESGRLERAPGDFRPTYLLAPNESLDTSQVEGLTDFFGKISDKSLSVEAVPDGREIDRSVEAGPLSKGIVLNISLKKLEDNGFSPININGQIKEILFYQEKIDQNSEEDGTSAVQVYTDQFGNLISKYKISYRGENENTSSSVIRIMPSIIFAPDSEGPDYKRLNIDLTQIGLGKIEGLFHVAVEKPVASIGDLNQYRVYSNIDSDDVNTLYESKFPYIAQGLSQAEELFGFSKGELVRNIYIINSEQQNAVFYRKDPETIAFWDEILKNRNDAHIIAAHEAYHLFDYKFQLSGGEFRAQYEDIKASAPWFLDEINEKNFLPEMPSGGHADENHLEFFASFLNSMNHPGWQDKVKDQSPEFISIYTKTLETFGTSLKNQNVVPVNAPIHDMIEQKITYLKGIVK